MRGIYQQRYLPYKVDEDSMPYIVPRWYQVMKLAAVVIEEHKIAIMDNVDTSDCVSYLYYIIVLMLRGGHWDHDIYMQDIFERWIEDRRCLQTQEVIVEGTEEEPLRRATRL